MFTSPHWLEPPEKPVIWEVEDERIKRAEPKQSEINEVQVEEEQMERVEERAKEVELGRVRVVLSSSPATCRATSCVNIFYTAHDAKSSMGSCRRREQNVMFTLLDQSARGTSD